VLTSWHSTSVETIAFVPFGLAEVEECNGDVFPAVTEHRLQEGLASYLQSQHTADSMHIQAGIHTVADDNEAFRPFRDGEGERSFVHFVKFERPFATVPRIMVALNHFDIASHTALRVNVKAERISASGFTLRYFTWANTQIFGLGAQWMAFHESPIS
jgi:H-type lectin domain